MAKVSKRLRRKARAVTNAHNEYMRKHGDDKVIVYQTTTASKQYIARALANSRFKVK